MQDLFKTGILFLLLQVFAFTLSGVMSETADHQYFSAFLIMAALSLVTVIRSKENTDARMIADLAASYAFGAFILDGISGGHPTQMIFGTAIGGFFVVGRAVGVASYLSKRPYKPERYQDAFMGALPLGVGIIASFLVMWNRAKPQR